MVGRKSCSLAWNAFSCFGRNNFHLEDYVWFQKIERKMKRKENNQRGKEGLKKR